MCNSCKEDKQNCKSYTISDFNLERYKEPILTIQKKVGREARNSKRRGMRVMEGNEIFIYNVFQS